jgi:ribosomal protein S18 acetylase RimI-like enzyme
MQSVRIQMRIHPKKRDGVFLFAQSNGEIVGVSSIDRLIGKQGHMGLFGISIADNYRDIGLGSCLMGKIIEAAKNDLEPKIKMLTLDVIADNIPAIALYRKMGFKKTASLPGYFQHRGGLLDVIVMTLYL